MRAKNITEVTDFSQSEWIKLINSTLSFKNNIRKGKNVLKGKRIGLLFDSNSLRTRLSFETAIHLLGGGSYFLDAYNLTHEKDGTARETYEDIVDTADRMLDAYVVRDYSQKIFEVFKKKNCPPFINGFCGVGHPSQVLADLSVIKWKKGKLGRLNYVGICPPEGSGVLESFIYGVLLLGEHITVVAPQGKIKGKNKDFYQKVAELSKKYGGKISFVKDYKEVIKLADVLYVDEWWQDKKNFLKRKVGKYKVDNKFLSGCKKGLSILHCLPAHPGREIDKDVMRGPYSLIFDEAEFRVYSAMSLLSFLSKN